jgi:hypothetical protein
VVIFISIIAGGLVIGRTMIKPYMQHAAVASGHEYLGTIQLGPDHLGRCENYELDNKHKEIRSLGSRPCGMAWIDPVLSEGSIGRMNGIARFFKTR